LTKVCCTAWLTACFIFMGLVDFAGAQDFAGIRVGDGAASVAKLGQPDTSETSGSFRMMRWKFQNGNELSVTFSKADKIIYMESDWGGLQEGARTDFPAMTFGTTTLADIRNRFGSNGLNFEHGTPVGEYGGAVILQNAYEVANVIMMLTTKVEAADLPSIMKDNSIIAKMAHLDAISICTPEYAKAMWGNRAYDPNYKKIEWR
jgi:hypothetical protein